MVKIEGLEEAAWAEGITPGTLGGVQSQTGWGRAEAAEGPGGAGVRWGPRRREGVMDGPAQVPPPGP